MKVYSQLKIPTLLAASLSCLMLAGCGTDDKPSIPSSTQQDNGKDDNNGGGKDDTKENKDITFRLANQSKSESKFIDGKVTLYANSTDTECDFGSETCGAIKFSTTIDEYQVLPEITKEKPATVTYKLSSPQGDVADILKDPSQVTGTITIHADPTPEKITPFGPPSPLVTIPLKEDAKNTGNWVVTVTLMDPKNPLAEAKIANTLEYIVVNSDGSNKVMAKVNDTGITFSGNNLKGNKTDCDNTMTSKQDCNTGRDAMYPPTDAANNINGWAGFDFTKLDKDGKDLAVDATDWSCVRDNVTGKVWERKTYAEKEADRDYRDVAWNYSYYNSEQELGSPTYLNDSEFSAICDQEDTKTNCTTEAYTQRVNQEKLCGISNWRLPSRNELFGIQNLNGLDASEVMHADWLFSSSEKLPIYFWTDSIAAFSKYGDPFNFDALWVISSKGSFNRNQASGSYSTDTNGVILVSDAKE
ncbi:Lcl domain-containing protein [Psychrobacter sp. I-STPA10]|uniref:Lcl domain-containing protein n=1 Tax=Psychrobacter sp. I-STPA10 TaxID=2585769 RepID=UPI001E37D48D|nr:DUF1566 domain-containing protein [Psychrobacter sp. I-STPA10]